MNSVSRELLWQVVLVLFLVACMTGLIYKFIGIYPEL